MLQRFEIIEHTADVGIKVSGKTLEELFENAAFGMYNIICENFSYIKDKLSYQNEISEIDLETLLVSFLNDLLYQTFVEKKLFCKFKTKITKEDSCYKISFSCFGENYDEKIHRHLLEIKSATFHNLKIQKIYEFFECVIIFDV